MTLILRIENYDQLDNGGPTSVRLDGRRASVGRRSNMDWVLPDPTKTISGHHFEIDYVDGIYWITDVSTNGTYRHGQRYRLDGPQALNGGERFVVGHYVIGVELPAATAHARSVEMPVGSPPQPPADGHGWEDPDAEDPWALPGGADTEDDPFAQPARMPPTGAVLDDLAGGFVPIQQPGQQQPLPGFGQTSALDYGLQSPAPHFVPDPYGAGIQKAAPILDPLYPGTVAPTPPPSSMPHSPNPLGGRLPSQDTDGGLAYPGAIPSAPRAQGFPAPTSQPDHPPQPLPPPPPPESPQPVPSPTTQGQNGSASEAALRAFCEGAGLDPSLARGADAAMLMFALGRTMRISAEEIMRMLRSRSDMKVFTRAGTRTMVAASGNNPMKFLPEPHEALEAMFLNARPGFMEGPDAFEDALKDVRLHQEAIFRALQPALRELLSGLSPEEIEATTEGSGNLLTAGRKGKHWTLFVERWDAKAKAGENGVLDAFLQAFARTYAIASARDHDKD